MNKVVKYIKDAYAELTNNVTWTSMTDLQNYTTIVLVSLVLLTFVILIMDKISEFLMISGVYDNI